MIPTYQNKSHFVSKQSRKRLTSIGDLPKSDEELIRYFQSYGILPSKENSLELRLTHFPYDEKKHKNGKYLGDKLNGGFKLKVPGQKKYRSIRPILLQQGKIPNLHRLQIMLCLMYEQSHESIGRLYGYSHICENGEVETNTDLIAHTHDLMRLVMAWAEYEYWQTNKVGGPKQVVEADAAQLGHRRKGGKGRCSRNRAFYLQTLVARDVPEEQKWGKRYFDLFRNPRGGPERLEHITPTFNELLLPGSWLCTDFARAYFAWNRDNAHKKVVHFAVCHKQYERDSFVWECVVDKTDGIPGVRKEHIVSVSTQTADSAGKQVKEFLKRHGRPEEANLKAHVKECQWRANHKHDDQWKVFMTQLGTLETRLRDGTISLEELRDIISWDYQDIDHPLADIDDKFGLDDLPYNHTYWICACLEVFTGTSKSVSAKKGRHKRKCEYYKDAPDIFEFTHDKSRCSCCVVLGRQNTKKRAMNMIYAEEKEARARKRRKKTKKKTAKK